MLILYTLQYLKTMPTKDWYGYNSPSGDNMPRYNLNHQDVDTIVSGLDHMSLSARSSKEHTRITNLKNRLISKLSSSDDDDEIDPWEVFNSNLIKDDE